MKMGSIEYKCLVAYIGSNPGCTASDWKAYWAALNDLVEVRGK